MNTRLHFNPKAPIKDWRRRRLLRRNGIGVELELELFRAGERSGTWSLTPAEIEAQSIVYSIGVGDNIAWDLALIERFGLTVHAFDPTPAAIAWLREQRLPAQFEFTPEGLGTKDGVQAFGRPRKQNGVNYRPAADDTRAEGDLLLPVRRLDSLLRSRGHTHIDVLKLDIEGGEYAVMPDVIRAAPRQLLIEFHHAADGTGFGRTLEALGSLSKAGYRIFAISERGLEFSFLRVDATGC